jgi:hypothetical protein
MLLLRRKGSSARGAIEFHGGMRSDSGAPRHVRTIAAPVFLADDAVAALAVSLPAAEHSTNDADALARAPPTPPFLSVPLLTLDL